MTNPMKIVFAIVIAAFIFTAIQRGDPTEGLLEFRAEGNLAYGYGTTDQSSLGTTRRFLNKYPEVDTLVLHAMPGTVDSDINIRIARMIRKRGLKTHLLADSYIASGAVDLFIAGAERTMECGARIGVHAWQSGLGYNPRDVGWDENQRYHESFLRDMGIDPAFYVFTREAAPPEGIHVLTADEIERFGLLTTPLNCMDGSHI